MRATTGPFFAYSGIFNIVAPLMSSMQGLTRLLHGKEALAWTPSRIFAFCYIFNSRASLHPRKPDRHLLDSRHADPSTKRKVGSFSK
jgi:hypothetical protein